MEDQMLTSFGPNVHWQQDLEWADTKSCCRVLQCDQNTLFGKMRVKILYW